MKRILVFLFTILFILNSSKFVHANGLESNRENKVSGVIVEFETIYKEDIFGNSSDEEIDVIIDKITQYAVDKANTENIVLDRVDEAVLKELDIKNVNPEFLDKICLTVTIKNSVDTKKYIEVERKDENILRAPDEVPIRKYFDYYVSVFSEDTGVLYKSKFATTVSGFKSNVRAYARITGLDIRQISGPILTYKSYIEAGGQKASITFWSPDRSGNTDRDFYVRGDDFYKL